MITYGEKNIEAGTHGIMLLSHGPLAKGIVETSELIVGALPNVCSFCLEAGDDIDAYRAAFAEVIDRLDNDLTILVDLQGGTPWNQLLYYMGETGRQLNIVTGMNLPMLLTALVSRDSSTGDALCEEIAETGRQGIFHPDTAALFADDDDEEEDDD